MLASFLQDTPTTKLIPALVQKLKDGLDLKTLVAAGSLANAREFGGQHYDGYHTFMAFSPAFEMSKELPVPSRALPILKVLYRNSTHIQAKGGRKNEAACGQGGPRARRPTRGRDDPRSDPEERYSQGRRHLCHRGHGAGRRFQ